MPRRTILRPATVRFLFIFNAWLACADIIRAPLALQRLRQVVDGLGLYLNQRAGAGNRQAAAAAALICAGSRSVMRRRAVTRPRRAWTRAKRQPRRSRLVTAPHASGCTRGTAVGWTSSAHEMKIFLSYETMGFSIEVGNQAPGCPRYVPKL